MVTQVGLNSTQKLIHVLLNCMVTYSEAKITHFFNVFQKIKQNNLRFWHKLEAFVVDVENLFTGLQQHHCSPQRAICVLNHMFSKGFLTSVSNNRVFKSANASCLVLQKSFITCFCADSSLLGSYRPRTVKVSQVFFRLVLTLSTVCTKRSVVMLRFCFYTSSKRTWTSPSYYQDKQTNAPALFITFIINNFPSVNINNGQL